MPREEARQTPSAASESPKPLVPISAADYNARRRRMMLFWLGVVVAAGLFGGWIYRRSVDPVNAQQSLEEGRRLFKAARYNQAILTLDHALVLNRDLVEAYLLRGRSYMALSRPEDAIADFTQAIRLRPADAEAYVERAQARLGREDYAGVIADCSAAIDRDSRLPLAFNLRGIAIRQSGNPQQSIADFTRAIDLAPDEANYFQRAATYQTLGQHALAIADLDQVIALKPDGPQAFYARALSRGARGDTAGANQDRRQALLLDHR